MACASRIVTRSKFNARAQCCPSLRVPFCWAAMPFVEIYQSDYVSTYKVWCRIGHGGALGDPKAVEAVFDVWEALEVRYSTQWTCWSSCHEHF